MKFTIRQATKRFAQRKFANDITANQLARWKISMIVPLPGDVELVTKFIQVINK